MPHTALWRLPVALAAMLCLIGGLFDRDIPVYDIDVEWQPPSTWEPRLALLVTPNGNTIAVVFTVFLLLGAARSMVGLATAITLRCMGVSGLSSLVAGAACGYRLVGEHTPRTRLLSAAVASALTSTLVTHTNTGAGIVPVLAGLYPVALLFSHAIPHDHGTDPPYMKVATVVGYVVLAVAHW